MTTPRQVTFRLNKAGDVIERASSEAVAVKLAFQREGRKITRPVLPPLQVLGKAKRALLAEFPDADTTDMKAVLGRFELQRYQYRGKTFKWLLENDAAYASYLIRGAAEPMLDQSEEAYWRSNVQHLAKYAYFFPPFVKMHQKLVAQKTAEAKAVSSGDPGEMKVGFGKFHGMTHFQLASSKEPKHVSYIDEFLLPKKDIQKGSAMDRLREYIVKYRSTTASSTGRIQPVVAESMEPSTERQPSSQPVSLPVVTTSESSVVTTVPVPPQVPVSVAASLNVAAPVTVPASKETRRNKWTCSSAQADWMESELKDIGLYPGTLNYNRPSSWEGKSLMRFPPTPELQKRHPSALPQPDPFYLHPMFVWMPESVCTPICPSLPCIDKDCHGHAKRRGLGKPRVVVAEAGQYYIFASQLMCDTCNIRPWSADSPKYLPLLPDCVRNIFPAHMTYRKAVDIGLIDRIRRSGRSPADVANEVNELARQKFERRHLQYLLLLQSVREQARSNLDVYLGFDVEAPSIDFGAFSDPDGYCGVEVSQYFIANCLVDEYEQQKSAIYGLLKGSFGNYIRCDHTRTLAKKVEMHSGAMWSYTIMNEFWEVISWVMVESESEKTLEECYTGLGRRFDLAGVSKPKYRWVDKWCCASPPLATPSQTSSTLRWDDLESASDTIPDRRQFSRRSACQEHLSDETEDLLDSFHCIRRLGRCCTSEAHSAYPRFMALLSNAFFLVDETDLQALRSARHSLGWDPQPTKGEIRSHCRMQIPAPYTLEKRVTAVMLAFCDVKDNRDLPLFTTQMLNEWSLQRTHIRRGCLSDPLDAGGVLYRLTGYVQLGHGKTHVTKLPCWQSLRGSSQLEGLHPHQAGWVTGTRVSAKLFQAQAMFGTAKWNMKRAAEHRKLKMPQIFNPLLTSQVNAASSAEIGSPKYPDFVLNDADTKEKFGTEYILHSPEEWDLLLDGEDTSDDSDTEHLDSGLQEEVTHLMELRSSTRARAEPIVEADFSSSDALGATLIEETETISRRDLDETAPSHGGLGTPEVPLVEGTRQESDAESTERVKSKRRPAATRRSTFSGLVTPWAPDRWTSEMKGIINKLLVTTKPPNRYQKVTEEYNRMVYDRADDPLSPLKITSTHFVQMYDRQVRFFSLEENGYYHDVFCPFIYMQPLHVFLFPINTIQRAKMLFVVLVTDISNFFSRNSTEECIIHLNRHGRLFKDFSDFFVNFLQNEFWPKVYRIFNE